MRAAGPARPASLPPSWHPLAATLHRISCIYPEPYIIRRPGCTTSPERESKSEKERERKYEGGGGMKRERARTRESVCASVLCKR